MQKITCHFDKAQYLPGEPVRLILPAHSALLSATFFRMERPVTLQAVREGDTVTLYIADTAPLYEWQGIHRLHAYLAMVPGKRGGV